MRIALLILAIMLCCCLQQKASEVVPQIPEDPQIQSPNTQLPVIQKATEEKLYVSRVIDGDTFELSNGDRVRLIGINAPEKGQKFYEKAKNRLKELIEGKEVVLERDVEDRDQYGRLLRYVFVNNTFVNLILVQEGLARTYFVGENRKYEKELLEAEKLAKSLQLGIWKKAEGCGDCIGIAYFKWNAEGDDCVNLNDEYVVFVNNCPYSCELTNWTVSDESSRKPFVFPEFVLESGGKVTLYTGCGINTKQSLYWCSTGYECNAIWNNEGDTLYLRDSAGNLVLVYAYHNS
ncbi:MAG: thermonuclease family protein [Archaeoglobaceae archaeon]